jgi:hypothetical protein
MFTRYSSKVQEYVLGAVSSASPGHCLTMWPFSAHHQNGRPQMGWQGRKVSTVHFAFYLLHGRKAEGQLNHTCHDKTCWNPHHVYEGSQKQNMGDMVDAGRNVMPKNARLTFEQADEIRARFAGGARGVALAAEYGVLPSTISNIVQNRIYKTDREYAAPPVKKLTYATAEEIRGRYRANESLRDLAVAYDVSATTISQIVNYKTHRPKASKA